MQKIKNVYDYINELAPFSLQESYDNSGLIIGNENSDLAKILVALDITKEIAEEAAEKNVDLIVTHHPVIFKAIKRVDTQTPLGILLKNDVAVISAHTSFDSAKGGMNDVLCKALDFEPCECLAVDNGVEIGYVCNTKEFSAKELAVRIKKCLGNKVVRYSDVTADKISRVAVMSGSGGEYLQNAVEKGCDAMITGDIKHNVFIDAHNENLALYDAGHFYTENLFCKYMCNCLRKAFPQLAVDVAQNNCDVTSYEI